MEWYLEVEVLGKWFGLGSRPLVDGISDPIQETPECSLSPSAKWGQGQKMSICEPESELSPDMETASTLLNFCW